MFRFIHTADWQIGAQFRQFGEKADLLRTVRLETFALALSRAREQAVDAFLVAGDLFEDNHVDSSTAVAVLELLNNFRDVRVFIAPGNHDPFTGPGSVWSRRPFSHPPEHVKVFTTPGVIEMGDACIIGNPLTQKRSTLDPSLRLAELAASLPADAIKVGLTHGAPAIESKHAADDFPIDLQAATRAGLDYLAIGHWHGPLTLDGGRLVMPGTPEPTDFAERGAGSIQLVEISAPGALPKVTAMPVARMQWRRCSFDFLDVAAAQRGVTQLLNQLADNGARAVVRVILKGNVSATEIDEASTWLSKALKDCAIAQIHDSTTVQFTDVELTRLRENHPLLAQVIGDLRALESRVCGVGTAVADLISTPDLAALCDRVGIRAEQLDAPFFNTAQRALLQSLRGVGA